jgi:hypothetical protein
VRFRTTVILFLLVVLGFLYVFFTERQAADVGSDRGRLQRLLGFQPEKLRVISLERGELDVELRRSAGAWRIARPIEARADSAAINKIIGNVLRLESRTVVSRSDRRQRGLDFGDYGLAPPQAILRLEGEDFRRLINVGSLSSDGASLYIACDNAKEDIFAVGTDILEALPSEVSQLRSKLIFDYDPAQVGRVEVKTADGFISLLRGRDGEWTIQQPLVAPAERAKVEAVINALCGLKVARFLTESDSDSAVFGFEEVESMVALRGKEDVLGVELRFGLPLAEGDDMIYASLKGDETVFAIPGQILEALRVLKVDDLRYRGLISGDPDGFKSVALKSHGQEIRMRRTDRGWMMTSPRSWKADDERVDAMIAGLSTARVTAFKPIDPETAWDGFATNSFHVALARDVASATVPNGGVPEYEIELEIRRSQSDDALAGVRQAGFEWISICNAAIFQSLNSDPLYYRDRAVLAIPREDIKSIVLKVGEREQMVERDEKGAFIAKAAPPGSTFATLDGKLQILRDLRCRDYVPQEDDSEADYGLKNPRAVLSLVLRGESGIGKSVLVGESLPDGSAYAAIRGQDGVFILAADVVRILLADLYAQTDRPIE